MPKRIHIKSTPVNIQKLIDSIGTAEAAVSLGVTPSALAKYIRTKKAPKASELAAQLILGANENQEATLLLRGSPDLIRALKAITAISGGKFKDFD